jgi:hypothetical protein
MSSTFLAGLAASASDSSEPECEPSRSAKLSHIAEQSSRSIGQAFQFTTTCVPSQVLGCEQMEFPWMSSAEASPARTSALRVVAPDSTETVLVSGANTDASSPRSDPVSSSLRTALLSELAALTGSSLTWKRSTTPANRSWWVLSTPELHTDGSALGLLPTPTAQSYGTNQGGAAGRTGPARPSLETMARQALWPTPTVKGNYNKKGLSARSGDGLATAVNMWPTRKRRRPANPGSDRASFDDHPSR